MVRLLVTAAVVMVGFYCLSLITEPVSATRNQVLYEGTPSEVHVRYEVDRFGLNHGTYSMYDASGELMSEITFFHGQALRRVDFHNSSTGEESEVINSNITP